MNKYSASAKQFIQQWLVHICG